MIFLKPGAILINTAPVLIFCKKKFEQLLCLHKIYILMYVINAFYFHLPPFMISESEAILNAMKVALPIRKHCVAMLFIGLLVRINMNEK